MPIFDLTSLRGGLDDTSPTSALADDACTLAENVEFVNSTLGERRLGCTSIVLPTTVTADVNLDAVTWMYRHIPTAGETAAELWLLAQSLTLTNNILVRRNQTAWGTITQIDAIDSTNTRGHRITAQTLHGKLFISYKSSVDRLHVYDGTSLRRTGLAEPGVPSAANFGSGTFSSTRYYRVRYTVMSGSTVLIRSEPSDSISFTPSGTGQGVRITKPATVSESETHWEVEASTDNANFYRLAQVIVATTTYDDTVDFSAGYAQGRTLSEDIGDYTLIPSGKYLSADEDRLIIAGSWENTNEASRVRWTPIFGGLGVGNDERLEDDTDPFLDLDGHEGGEITGLSRTINGYLFAFKRTHIYKIIRTGRRSQAYEAFTITKTRGALPGSLVEAIDQAGNPAVYFLDPSYGPNRIGARGLQWCGRDIQTLWKRVNVNAKVPCHGVYYNDKRQLHYWVALDGSDYPNAKIILHINEMRDTEEGGRRGWVTVAKDNRIATAHCSTMFADNIDTSNPREFALVPFIGKEEWVILAATIRDYVQRCDTGSTDAFTVNDTDADYRGKLKSKPFALAGLTAQSGIRSGYLLAKAVTNPVGKVYVRAIKDFGLDSKTVSVDLRPAKSETHVLKQLDNFGISEMQVVQIELGDLDDTVDPATEWELSQLQLVTTGGQKA